MNGQAGVYAIGSDVGIINRAFVYGTDGGLINVFQPYEPGYSGGVRVAIARGPNGAHTLVTGPGPGRFPDVNLFDIFTGGQIGNYQPFESTFVGGLFLSTGDFLREGYDAVVLSPDKDGGPRVQIRSGRTGAVFADFFAIADPSFRGGARTAVADVNGDGTPDLIVSAGFGGGPRVAIWDGKTLRPGVEPQRLVADFFAFDTSLRNGVYVAAGDINADGKADLVAGAGPGGGPRVRIFAGTDLLAGVVTPKNDFFSGDLTSRGGVRVVVKNLNGDANADLITSDGPGGGNKARVYVGDFLIGNNPPFGLATFDQLPGYTGGVFVG